MVAQVGDYIRHLPGIQIRMISGFYRAPDIMAWHAAMLASIAIAMAVRSGVSRWSWAWMLAGGWGFFNALISGRRKAIYFIAAFAAAFLWRYFRRLKTVQVTGIIAIGLVAFVIVQKVSEDEKASVYTKGALATRQEFTARLEGGLVETIAQYGMLGAGLGSATQGAYHVAGAENLGGWQEGGLGKLAIELGLPGLLAAVLLAVALIKMMLAISAHPDIPESSQFARATLFGLVIANIANFLASAQSYSDPVLTLISAFLLGCLFATATLDERAVTVAARSTPLTAPATA
jgi:O-antigen ligase